VSRDAKNKSPGPRFVDRGSCYQCQPRLVIAQSATSRVDLRHGGEIRAGLHCRHARCSEQSRRNAVTQSHGATAGPSATLAGPPANRPRVEAGGLCRLYRPRRTLLRAKPLKKANRSMEAPCCTLVSCSCSETHYRKAPRGGACCLPAWRRASPGGSPLPCRSSTADGGKRQGPRRRDRRPACTVGLWVRPPASSAC